MNILLLHPEDGPENGPWVRHTWDRIVDLGIAGQDTYRRWAELCHCPVSPLDALDAIDFAQLRAAMNAGHGIVVDQFGLDWWELISIEFHQQLEVLTRLQKLANQIEAGDKVFVTRPCIQANLLTELIGRPVRNVQKEHLLARKLKHYARVIPSTPPAQILQVLGDKYDPGYRFRRYLAPQGKGGSMPVVLLPSAYANVSRTALQYAQALPDFNFLLVATRQHGWIANPPANVTVARLASYAPDAGSGAEFERLLLRWNQLKLKLADVHGIGVLLRLGILDGFQKVLRDGLAIRDAWLNLFSTETITGVLCADEANPATQLPLLIAASRGMPTVACHHGALDGRYRYRASHAGFLLAKGRMERDYLIYGCGVSRQQVEIGAPGNSATMSNEPRPSDAIVFFSEPYEIGGGRVAEFYGEILPLLAKVAAATGRQLIVKLHPMESLRERQKIVNEVLDRGALARTRVVHGRLTDELLSSTWCAVTILSTTAVDCTLRGIPVFLCEWLDYSSYGYLQQFAKFGAGRCLRGPSEIADIPRMVESFAPPDTRDLHEPITSERLGQLLSEKMELAPAI